MINRLKGLLALIPYGPLDLPPWICPLPWKRVRFFFKLCVRALRVTFKNFFLKELYLNHKQSHKPMIKLMESVNNNFCFILLLVNTQSVIVTVHSAVGYKNKGQLIPLADQTFIDYLRSLNFVDSQISLLSSPKGKSNKNHSTFIL